jgi:hypothetical protein
MWRKYPLPCLKSQEAPGHMHLKFANEILFTSHLRQNKIRL